jgi:hypothetical protein
VRQTWCKLDESLHRRSIGGHDGDALVASVSRWGHQGEAPCSPLRGALKVKASSVTYQNFE